MRSTLPAPSPPNSSPQPAPAPESSEAGDEPGAARNFWVMVAYYLAMRVGWIFKTESIVMPAVADTLGYGGWLRGCLPLLNRLGNSVPPLMLARRIKISPLKKYSLFGTSAMMAACFLWLSLCWSKLPTGPVLAVVFLATYFVFFVSTGVNQLILNTLHGKLIPTNRRGLLLMVSNLVGATMAIGCAWWLLPTWLKRSDGYVATFFFTGGCFLAAAGVSLFLSEPRDAYRQPRSTLWGVFAVAWETLRTDPNFLRLAVVSSLFNLAVLLFPHYQAIGRERLGIATGDLLTWVIVQNAGTALFSLIAGPLADRLGNRFVLRIIIFGIATAPLLAVYLPVMTLGPELFPVVFLLVGLTPVAIRTFQNYTLELAEPAEHPRYLSTLALCSAAPIMFSPLIGYFVDLAGFTAVFLAVAALILLGGALTFTLHEPRHHAT